MQDTHTSIALQHYNIMKITKNLTKKINEAKKIYYKQFTIN